MGAARVRSALKKQNENTLPAGACSAPPEPPHPVLGSAWLCLLLPCCPCFSVCIAVWFCTSNGPRFPAIAMWCGRRLAGSKQLQCLAAELRSLASGRPALQLLYRQMDCGQAV